jgi:hypothetical protein
MKKTKWIIYIIELLYDLGVLIIFILYMMQVRNKIDDLALINYWLIIDMIMIILKHPYKKIGKILMQMKITDRNVNSL